MAKYRNIPQATKDNVLHYINQVYDEAYELGYQHGKRQGKWYIVEYDFFTCDQCKESVPNGAEDTQEAREMLKTGNYPSYCENCGARMES